MIGLVLGETQLGSIIIKRLESLGKEYLIIDLSLNKLFKKKRNSFPLNIGQLGKALSILKKHKCDKVLFAGRVSRPNFSKIKLDFKALYYLPKIIKSSKISDSSIIKVVINIFKKEGFKIIRSTFFNPELILKKGRCTKIKPNLTNKKDILKARNVILGLTKNNVGQGIVVRKGHIIAIEEIDGTDAMLNRASTLIKKFYNKNKRDGVLLKFPKRNQDLRVDLPVIGIRTVQKCIDIGLKGIVVKCNQNIFLDRTKCIKLANKNKMFILGV